VLLQIAQHLPIDARRALRGREAAACAEGVRQRVAAGERDGGDQGDEQRQREAARR